jgi:hypothetical protein
MKIYCREREREKPYSWRLIIEKTTQQKPKYKEPNTKHEKTQKELNTILAC